MNKVTSDNFDYTDFYIIYNNHPYYNPNEIISDDVILNIIQKYQMVLFTNKGELLGDENFGADILRLLYQTSVSEDYIRKVIYEQINNYISELNNYDFSIEISFVENTYDFSDILVISLKISEYEVNNFFA